MRPARALVLVSCLLLVYALVAAITAITQDRPAEFSMTPADDPETVVQWIVRGTSFPHHSRRSQLRSS